MLQQKEFWRIQLLFHVMKSLWHCSEITSMILCMFCNCRSLAVGTADQVLAVCVCRVVSADSNAGTGHIPYRLHVTFSGHRLCVKGQYTAFNIAVVAAVSSAMWGHYCLRFNRLYCTTYCTFIRNHLFVLSGFHQQSRDVYIRGGGCLFLCFANFGALCLIFQYYSIKQRDAKLTSDGPDDANWNRVGVYDITDTPEWPDQGALYVKKSGNFFYYLFTGSTHGEIAVQVVISGKCGFTTFAFSCIHYVVHSSALQSHLVLNQWLKLVIINQPRKIRGLVGLIMSERKIRPSLHYHCFYHSSSNFVHCLYSFQPIAPLPILGSNGLFVLMRH